MTGRTDLLELARLFLKIGTISVGGPAAHIALMHEEIVVRRQWLTAQEFLDLVGATNLIPGPNSTEMAIHIGRVRAGWPGLLVAGGCFILPAVLIVAAAAAVYVRFGALPETRALFYGINPVVIAIVAIALWKLGRTAVTSLWYGALALAALAAAALGVNELIVLVASGLVAGTVRARFSDAGQFRAGALWAAAPVALTTTLPGVAGGTLGSLFVVFLKAGALLFGSGYVLLAFLRADLVQRLGWLTEAQLLDAVAIGQVTPGPVFTTATFIGYLLAGVPGAVVATLAIFLPAFVYVAISGPIVPRLRRSPVANGILDGLNLASFALMALVTSQLGRAAIVDAKTGMIAAASAAAIILRVNPAWLIAGGALAGVLSSPG